LERIVRQLVAAGWKITENQATNGWDNHVQASRGNARLEIFRQRNERMSFSFDEKPATNFNFVAHYRSPFTRTEREAALEKLFAAPASVESLLPFLNSFSSEQRRIFYELVEKSPVTSPQACVRLAEQYLDRKRTNDAVHLLLRATALVATLKDPSAIQSAIETTTKKISPKKDLKLEVTPDLCRELGFLELTNLTQTIEQCRDMGQPLIFFGPGKRGVKIFSLTISQPQKNSYPWLLVQAEDGSRSSSWSSFTLSNQGDWQNAFTFDEQTLKCTAVPLPDKKQVHFSIQIGR
jgi:AraC-like DNA-binding protein